MTNTALKIQKLTVIFLLLQIFMIRGIAQYKTYQLTTDGDTLNAIDNKGQKQGKWVIKVAELRGNPGYDEEGIFRNDKKEGVWRRYSVNGDLLAMENYKYGGKHGLQQYFTMLGDLTREESWRSYNPDAPYDTIPIYGQGNNEIVSYKIIKAEQYSVKHGDWKYYDPTTGRLMKLEKYDRGTPVKDPEPTVAATDDKPKKIAKPQEVLEYEKKNSGKKKVKLRNGQTGM